MREARSWLSAFAVACLVLPALWAGCYAAGFRFAYVVPGISDLHSYFLPKYAHAASRLAEGRLPLWNPYELLGLPFLATIQPATLYPPVRLVHLLLAGEAAQRALLLLHLALGAFFSIGFARSIGLSLWPAVLASAWVVQPMWLLRVYEHPIYPAGLVWLPALWLFSRQSIRAPSIRGIGCLAAVAALEVLAGYPPLSLASAYACAVAVPFWLYEERAHLDLRRAGAGIAALSAASLLAGLLAAAQVLPAARYVLSTDRRTLVDSTVTALSAHASPVLRYLMGLPELTFAAAARDVWLEFGPALLLCAVAAAGSRRCPVPRTYLALLFCVAAFAPFGLLRHLPLYGLVRFGQEWTFLAPIPLFLLAAIGVEALLAAKRRARSLSAVLVLLVLSLSVAWNLARPERASVAAPPPVHPALPASVRDACDLAPGHFRLYWPAAQVVGTLLEARIASPGGVEQSLPPPRSADVLRILGIDTYLPGAWPAGFAAHPGLARRLSIQCLLAPRRVPGIESSTDYRPVASAGVPGVLYRSEGALPRARMAFRAQWAASPEAQLALLREGAVPDDAVLLEGSEPAPHPVCAEPSARVDVLEAGDERMRFRTSASCAGYLVVADSWDEGWRARVDGQPVPVLRADYALRAVAVREGTHEITLAYEPPEVRWGLGLSGLGLALLAASVLAPLLRGGVGSDPKEAA